MRVIQRIGIRPWLPPSDVPLNHTVVQCLDVPLDECDFAPIFWVGVREMVEDPHAGVQLLYGLRGKLINIVKLGAEYLRFGLGQKPILVSVQKLGQGFRRVFDIYVDDGLEA